MKSLIIILLICFSNVVYSQITISQDGVPLVNKQIYTKYGTMSTDQNGKVAMAYFVDYLQYCDTEEYPEKITIVYAEKNKIAHCFTTKTAEQSVDLVSQNVLAHRVQVHFSAQQECFFFVSGYSKPTTCSGTGLEVITVPKVSSVTCVFFADGYQPFVKTVSINTKDNSVSKVDLGNIVLKPISCQIATLQIGSEHRISDNNTISSFYSEKKGTVWFNYVVYDRDAAATYVASTCVEVGKFSSEKVYLQVSESLDEEMSSSKIPYVRIDPILDFAFTPSNVSKQQSKDTVSISQTTTHGKESPSSPLLRQIMIGLLLFGAVLLLYRLIWGKNMLRDFKILK